jgi:hypothetical protein
MLSDPPGTLNDLLRERLVNQQLAGSGMRDPREIVSWFGAIQAQDFQGAKWAIGLRANELTDAAVERSFNEGGILRTHVLRPTWHFVTAADIRWLVALTGPRVIARMAYRHRQLGLDAATVRRSRAALSRALAKAPLTRGEVAAALRRARIPVTPERLGHLLMLAEMEGLVCSGPLCDRQLTYDLMDRRAPGVDPVDASHALARLADRYFNSHGPATLADFAWWSGLSLRDAGSAVAIAGRALTRDALIGGTYRSARPRSRRRNVNPRAWLLPDFDEYLVAYRDRAAVLGDHAVAPRDVLTRTVIVDGRAVATWRVRREKDSVSIVVAPRQRLARDDQERIRHAAARYSSFIGRPCDTILEEASRT